MRSSSFSFPSFIWRNRAAVFIFSLLLITIAGVSVSSWIAFVTHVQRAADHDRARLQAFYAAEAGIDHVVDWFNNPGDFKGTLPSAYIDNGWDVSPYPAAWDGAPATYHMFSPYILLVDRDNNGDIMTDANGDPVVIKSTFLRDQDNLLSSKIPTCKIDLSKQSNLIFTNSDNTEIARIESIYLINPAEMASIEGETPPAGEKILCKVISTGRTPQGVVVTVETLLRENPFSAFGSLAAIISRDTFSWDGHFDVHWGEVWAEDITYMHGNWTSNGVGHFPTASEDIWVKARTEAWIKDDQGDFADGYEPDGFADNSPAGQDNEQQPYVITQDDTTTTTNDFEEYSNLYQQQDLNWPSYDYATVKEWFIENGLPYYVTDTEGNIWGQNANGDWVSDTYSNWFGADHTDLDAYWNPYHLYAFIDSVPVDANGNPFPFGYEEFEPFGNYQSYDPEDPRANVVTVDVPSNVHTRGGMFFAADVTGQGQGNVVNASEITDINGNPYFVMPNYQVPKNKDLPSGGNSDRIFHNGMFYVYGTVDFSGNRGVYGSIYAKDGYTGTGTVGVFYNYRLKDGTWMDTNQSVVLRDYWRIRTEALPELS